jgi:hypothetical protein
VKEKEKVHHVFWTGGLDSSFRVINLLRTSGDLIQAHYVIRHENSTGKEIDAMNNIRRAITRKYPDLRPRLLPTIYINEDLIPESVEVDAAVEKLRKEMSGVHEQYQILAKYCKAYNIDQIDLTYERYIGEASTDTIGVSQFFGKSFPFESFMNPHAHLTKKECYNMAKSEGWADLLKLTSFCRRPRRNGRPCGLCGPCHDAVKQRMGFRLPLGSRIKARILIPFRSFYRKNYDKHGTKRIFRVIKKRFENKL